MATPVSVTHDTLRFKQALMLDSQFIPNVAADIIDGDFYLIYLEIKNKGGQAFPKFTLNDKQSTPHPVVFGNDTPVPIGSTVTFDQPQGLKVTGGLNWVCDTANALSCKIVYRKP